MPVLPASDGKDYEFPEGTSASVAMKFLNTKGLSLRLPNAQVVAPMAASHAPTGGQMSMEASHILGGGTLGAMQAPAIDPLTGRQQTAGSTMSEAETFKYGTRTLPAAGLIAGGAMAGGPAGVGLAALGMAGGEAWRQLLNTFGAPQEQQPSSSVAAAGIGKAAYEGAKAQLEGEVIGGGITLAAKGIGRAAPAIKTWLGKTAGGEILRGEKVRQQAEAAAAVILKNKATVETAENAAKKIADEFSGVVLPETMPQVGRTLEDSFNRVFHQTHDTMYEDIKAGLAATGETTDLSGLAQRLVKLEDSVPRFRGTFKPTTEPDPAWAELITRARRYSKGTVEQIPARASKILDVSGKPIVTQVAGEVEKAAVDSAEAAAALIDGKGAVAQRIRDLETMKKSGAHINEEYLTGLKEINRGFRSQIAEVGGPQAAEALNAADAYYARGAQIKESAVYKIAKTRPENLPSALLDPRHPENATMFHKMAGDLGTEGADMVEIAQKHGIDKLLGNDIASFDQRLTAAGKSADTFFTGKSKEVIARLSEQSKAARALEEVPKIEGMPPGATLSEVLLRSAPKFAGLRGFTFDATTYVMARVAENPAASRLMVRGLDGLAKGGAFARNAPRYINAAVNLVSKKEAPNAAQVGP